MHERVLPSPVQPGFAGPGSHCIVQMWCVGSTPNGKASDFISLRMETLNRVEDLGFYHHIVEKLTAPFTDWSRMNVSNQAASGTWVPYGELMQRFWPQPFWSYLCWVSHADILWAGILKASLNLPCWGLLSSLCLLPYFYFLDFHGLRGTDTGNSIANVPPPYRKKICIKTINIYLWK